MTMRFPNRVSRVLIIVAGTVLLSSDLVPDLSVRLTKWEAVLIIEVQLGNWHVARYL
jgi:hypothetical protein